MYSTEYSDIVKQAAQICYKRQQDKLKSALKYDGGRKKNIFSHILEDGNSVDYQQQHNNNQYNILKKYYDFQWPAPDNFPNCPPPSNDSVVAKLNPSQKFLLEYFQPSLDLKGMLLWHSVGSGKTCTLVSIASGHFEQENWRIVYICRKSLLNSFYKNVFDTICHHRIRNLAKVNSAKEADKEGKKPATSPKKRTRDGGKNVYTTIPPPKSASTSDIKEEKNSNQKKLLNNTLWTEPLTYAQLGNLCDRINARKLGDTPIDKHIRNDYRHENDPEGREATRRDPLYKTLLIIDEAHYLFKEDPDDKQHINRDAIEKALLKSHDLSGPNSAKVLLLTATPMFKHPIEFIKLMNLLRPREEQIDISRDSFLNMIDNDIKEDDNDGTHETMLNFIGKHFCGYVSYLDRSGDPSQFAQVQKPYTTINTDMTKEQEKLIKRKMFGIKENQSPIPNPNPKPVVKQEGNLSQQIRSILSDQDYTAYYNLVKAYMTKQVDNTMYANEIRRLFYNYPDIVALHLAGGNSSDGGARKKKSKK
jgi:hypothetical protein